MVRNFFKKKRSNEKLDNFIQKYNIPRSYLSTTRKNVARAVFIGVFIGFIPAPGHMLAVIALMPFARFNVPIAITSVWIANPVTMPFIYFFEYKVGAMLLGMKIDSSMQMNETWILENIKHIFVPLYFGTAIVALSVSALLYMLINFCWRRSVTRARYKNKTVIESENE